jgi:hypothetical protein
MTKEEAILRYRATMAVFTKWLTGGVITNEEMSAIETKLAQKYGLSTQSIYLERNLLCGEKRVIYGSVKGGYHEQKNHET